MSSKCEALGVWQKGCGYHLDLFWVGILMAACSFMGLPWYVAATVISIAHIDSLKMESESSAPGEQPQFLGVRLGQHGFEPTVRRFQERDWTG